MCADKQKGKAAHRARHAPRSTNRPVPAGVNPEGTGGVGMRPVEVEESGENGVRVHGSDIRLKWPNMSSPNRTTTRKSGDVTNASMANEYTLERMVVAIATEHYRTRKPPMTHTGFGGMVFRVKDNDGNEVPAGHAPSTWRKVRKGRRRITVEEAALIADALGYPLHSLIFEAHEAIRAGRDAEAILARYDDRSV